MEFANVLSVTLDTNPAEVEPNNSNIQRTNVYQCSISFGKFVICLISFCVFIGLPMIEFVIGIVYLKKCSMNFYIPIYLIIAGLISSIIFIFAFLGRIFLWPLLDDFKLKTIKSFLVNAGVFFQMMFSLAIIFLLFDLAWFVMGNIWIFSSQPTVQFTNSIGSPTTYCNRVVYLTGFGSLIIKYIFIWVLICLLNCYLYFDVRTLAREENQV